MLPAAVGPFLCLRRLRRADGMIVGFVAAAAKVVSNRLGSKLQPQLKQCELLQLLGGCHLLCVLCGVPCSSLPPS